MKCPKCKDSHFASEDELAAHIVRFHKKEKMHSVQYTCSRCSASYISYSSLKSHLKTCVPVAAADLGSSSSTASTSTGISTGIANLPLADVESSLPLADVELSLPLADDNGSDQMSSSDSEGEDDNEIEPTSEEILQQKAVFFLAHLKGECNATKRIISEVVRYVDDLNQVLLTIVEEKIIKEAGIDEVMTTQRAAQVVRNLKGFSLFQGAQDFVSHLIGKGGLVEPVKVVLESRPELRDGKLVQRDVEFAYTVPFLPQLERMLNCPEILHCVDTPRESDRMIYKTVLDGHFFKSHPVLLKDENPVVVIGYTDGIDIVDSASARAGQHGLTNIYWTLANIHPELRSSDRIINLLGTVKSASLNDLAWEKILEDFTESMKKLASDEGVKLTIHGTERVFHGLLLFVCGDHPALANIGGFKESVSKSLKPCRQCLATNPSYLQITDVDAFELRNMCTHEQHVAAVEGYKPLTDAQRQHCGSGQEHHDPSIRYGVNRRSPLMSIPHFDVTKCLVEDIMHILPEGLQQLVAKLVLSHVVKEKNSMTLPEINQRIEVLGQSFKCDRPSSRNKDEHLKNNLRQSSAQMMNLVRILPFVLRKQSDAGGQTFAGDPQYLTVLLQIIKIMNLCMAYSLTADDAMRLSNLVSEFHKCVLELVPDLSMAKMHFAHHFCMQIILFGVLRQQACFRFEAHHAFFKRLFKITKNFINVTFSAAWGHQTRQSQLMMKPNFLYEGHKFTVKALLPVSVIDRSVSLVKNLFPELKEISEIDQLSMYGTLYNTTGDCVILLSDTGKLPEFAKILNIFCIDKEKFAFVCLKLKTNAVNHDVNAYEVSSSAEQVAIDAQKLIFPHAITSIKFHQKWYILVQGHRLLCT